MSSLSRRLSKVEAALAPPATTMVDLIFAELKAIMDRTDAEIAAREAPEAAAEQAVGLAAR